MFRIHNTVVFQLHTTVAQKVETIINVALKESLIRMRLLSNEFQQLAVG